MAETVVPETVYRMVLNPRMPSSPEANKKCLVALTKLAEFSLEVHDTEKEEIEYRRYSEGKMTCKLRLSRDGVSVRTTDEQVSRDEWLAWSSEILDLVGPAMGWRGHDLAILAVVHDLKFPKTGNNYEFLRDALLQDSQLHRMIGKLTLYDLDIRIQGPISPSIDLFLKITSNQNRSEIMGGALDDEDNRLSLALHAVRMDPREADDLVTLVGEQESLLDEWLQSSLPDASRIFSA